MGNLNYSTPQVQQRLAQGYYDDIKAAGYDGTKTQLDAILAKAGLAATQSAAGQMSAADKKKLDGIATGANNYTLPKSASSTLGGIKTGYTTSGKNYAIQVDANGNAYVYVPWTDTNTTYPNMTGATTSAVGKAGLVPAPAAGAATRYLRSDGTWQVPPNSVYSHPTTEGNKHIPAGGSSGQILRWSADGTAVWGSDNNTVYKAATTTNDGLMSKSDKTKLNACPTATGLTRIQKITQAAYDALQTKDANTLYIIVG